MKLNRLQITYWNAKKKIINDFLKPCELKTLRSLRLCEKQSF